MSSGNRGGGKGSNVETSQEDDTVELRDYAESDSSQQGIWRTVDVTMEWDGEKTGGGKPCEKECIVPKSLMK